VATTALAGRISSLPNVSETIAATLTELIFSGKLHPGQRLVQSQLAEEFGVSRVPVRDALHFLEQRSLVVTRPRRGVIVRPISRQGLHEIFALRRILEPPALEEILANLGAAELDELEAIVDAQAEAGRRGDMATAFRQDQRFHDLLNSRISNSLLKEMTELVWTRNRQVRSVMRASDRGGAIVADSVERHRRLLEALRARDIERGRAILLRTIEVSEREIFGELERLDWFDNGEHLRSAPGRAQASQLPGDGRA
jgi:DNA-binding GntR family transcriptional regulator